VRTFLLRTAVLPARGWPTGALGTVALGTPARGPAVLPLGTVAVGTPARRPALLPLRTVAVRTFLLRTTVLQARGWPSRPLRTVALGTPARGPAVLPLRTLPALGTVPTGSIRPGVTGLPAPRGAALARNALRTLTLWPVTLRTVAPWTTVLPVTPRGSGSLWAAPTRAPVLPTATVSPRTAGSLPTVGVGTTVLPLRTVSGVPRRPPAGARTASTPRSG
jgi:hypothetical protein